MTSSPTGDPVTRSSARHVGPSSTASRGCSSGSRRQALVHAASALRMLVALLVLAALVANAAGALQDGLFAQNISYFTNQSNLMFVTLVIAGTMWTAPASGVVRRRARRCRVLPRDDRDHLCAARGTARRAARWDIGWTGIVLHRLAPVVAVADWLLTPRSRPPAARRILWWQLYPVLFLALTWVRGGITGWYPYGFLDPTLSSWSQVLLTTVVVLVAFFAVATLLHLLGGRPDGFVGAPGGSSLPSVRSPGVTPANRSPPGTTTCGMRPWASVKPLGEQ